MICILFWGFFNCLCAFCLLSASDESGILIKTFPGGKDWVRRKEATSSAHLSTVSSNIPHNSSGKLLDAHCFLQRKKVLQKNMRVKIPCGLLHEVTTTRHRLWFRVSRAMSQGGEDRLSSTTHLSFFISFPTGLLLAAIGDKILDQEGLLYAVWCY